MTQLLETTVHEGKKIVAVKTSVGTCMGCVGMGGNCNNLPPCNSVVDGARRVVVWMYPDQAALARLRGEIR